MLSIKDYMYLDFSVPYWNFVFTIVDLYIHQVDTSQVWYNPAIFSLVDTIELFCVYVVAWDLVFILVLWGWPKGFYFSLVS